MNEPADPLPAAPDRDAPRPGVIRRTVRWLLRIGAAGGFLLAVVCFFAWRSDRAEVRDRVTGAITANASPSRKMREALRFMEREVGYERHDDYFLLPLFRPLRPTALQVLQKGGDCAYRGRAYIVVLDLFGVDAHKLALFDPQGEPVHAVVRVATERGPYLVDLLFNLVHEDEDGNPLSLDELQDPAVLRASLARAAAAGNPRIRLYPPDQYVFTDVRTINWEKGGLTRAAYAIAKAFLGKEGADTLPRPYLLEEPALMVLVASATGGLGCLVLLGLGTLFRRRREHRAARAA